jgi:chromosome segregation ATPase
VSAVRDIIALGAKLAECQLIVERSASLEQAIGETEARLAKVRAEEDEARASARAAVAELDAKIRENYAKWEATQAATEAENAKRQRQVADQAALAEASARADLEDLENKIGSLRVELAHLAVDKDRYQTAIASLKAEFDALRARLA